MPLIAMTREMGSLGKDVAAGIAQRANKKVVYHEIIEPLANKMRLRKSHVARLLEGRAGLWEKLQASETSLSIYTADETFRMLLDETTGVLRGWGAVHLLADVFNVLNRQEITEVDQVWAFDQASNGNPEPTNTHYGLANNWQQPRTVRFGLRVSF